MSIGAFPISNVLKVYNRTMRAASGKNDTGGRESFQVQDRVSISTEARKRQLVEHARRDIIERVKNTR